MMSVIFSIVAVNLLNVLTAFCSSWSLHSLFYGENTTEFRASRIAPAVGIFQIIGFAAANRKYMRRLGPETEEQKTLLDFLAGLGSAVGLGLGVIIADIMRSARNKKK